MRDFSEQVCGTSDERHQPGAQIATLMLNGAVGAWIDPAGLLSTAVTFVFEGSRIARIYAIRNPHKLGLEQVAELSR